MNTGMRRLRQLRDDHAGFTLIELVVASSLTVLVAVVIGGILISTLGTEKTVRSTTAATSAGQLVAQSIDKGVRNASWISPGPYLTATGAYFLTVRTVTATGNSAAPGKSSCQAWYITAAGTAYVQSAPTKITQPAAGNVSGWTMLATGLSPHGGESLLSVGLDSRQIVITFEVDAGDAPNVLVNTSALKRQITTESAPCA